MNRDRSKDSPAPVDSLPNPAGAARRRMIRTLGSGGGMALAGIIAGGWKKPVVEAVLLPAHATQSDTSQPDCTLFFTNVVSFGGLFTAGIAFDANTVTQVPTDDDQITVTASTIVNANQSNFYASGLVAISGGGEASQTVSASCCTNTFADTATITLANFTYSVEIIYDDGICSIVS